MIQCYSNGRRAFTILEDPARRIDNCQARLPYQFGTNFRMSRLTGDILRAQFRKLDRTVDAVRVNARPV